MQKSSQTINKNIPSNFFSHLIFTFSKIAFVFVCIMGQSIIISGFKLEFHPGS
jgi:hypothetical protein